MSNDGKLYEELIYNKLKSQSKFIDENYNEITLYEVEKDFKVRGYKTESIRQIDVAIKKRHECGEDFIVIECKNYNDTINISILEAFLSKLDDVHANRGIMFTTKGYPMSAYNFANSSRGIRLKILTLEELNEYLYHDYNYNNGPCRSCKNRINWTGDIENGHVNYYEFDNVITKNEKYFKIFSGNCDECGDVHLFCQQCKTTTVIMNQQEYYNIFHGMKIKPRDILCDDNCGLLYSINEYGQISYAYKGEECKIVGSGCVKF